MLPRGSGVLLHISSLPSPYGIGDLGPGAFRFADLLHEARQTYWQVLPLNPTQTSDFNSPYVSCSSRAGNTLLISVDILKENGLLDETECSPPVFPENEVDYVAVTDYKTKLLESAYNRFRKRSDTSLLERFCRENAGWLDEFAIFMTLKSRFGNKPWNLWPEPFKHRDEAAIKNHIREYKDDIEKQKWFQYIFFEQWAKLKRYCNERSVKIIGDIPIYVSYDSADVWAHPSIFKLDGNLAPEAVSGVPPDYFSETGQLWNNPVYNWKVLEEQRFSWWIDRIKRMFELYDILRIDHFRGLVQYWEIPAGEKSALNGEWKPVPTFKFFDTLLEQIPSLSVIAEDLGIITDDVREVMAHYGFPGMKVLLFAFSEDNLSHPYLPHCYEKNCVVYTGTHDNNTVRGWFEEEADDRTRKRFLEYAKIKDPSLPSIVKGMIRLALESPADCAIIPAQDYLGLGARARMNRPAIPEGNWKWRMTEEQMLSFPVKEIKDMTLSCGREYK